MRTLRSILAGLFALWVCLAPVPAMLVVNELNGFNAAGAGVVDITFTDSAGDATNLTTYTLSSLSFGTEAADRQIVVGVFGRTNSRTVSSMTIGGVAATQVVAGNNASNGPNDIWMAAVPTGTTGTVSVTFSGAMIRAAVAVWRMTGANPTAVSTGSDVGTDPSATINVPVNGGAVGFCNSAATTSNTWVGLTEDLDTTVEGHSYSAAHTNLPAGNASLLVQCDWINNTVPVFATASWGPS